MNRSNQAAGPSGKGKGQAPGPSSGQSTPRNYGRPLDFSKTYTVLLSRRDPMDQSTNQNVLPPLRDTREATNETVPPPDPQDSTNKSPADITPKLRIPALSILSGSPGFTLYKPSGYKSNRQMVRSAIDRHIYPGPSPIRQSVLATLDGFDKGTNHFLILLRHSHTAQYRGLYVYVVDIGVLERVHGLGPLMVSGDDGIEKYLKFNSSKKQFEVIPTKTLSIIIDAFTVPNSYWVASKPDIMTKPSGSRR